MSIFSETKLDLVDTGKPIAVAISNTISLPLVAVALPNRVIFYDENGEKLQYEIVQQINPCRLHWHPKISVLAIGWESGLITLTNLKLERSKDEPNYHQSPIKELIFNRYGLRMASVDQFGNIAIWKELNCICAYDKECDATAMASADFILKRKNNRPRNVNLFFVGGMSGVVWYANDTRCEELCRMDSPIFKILFCQQDKTVVVINRKFGVSHFKIQGSNMGTPIKQYNLNFNAPLDKVTVGWLSPSSYTVAIWDRFLRVTNVATGENYKLSITDSVNNAGPITIVNGKIISSEYIESNQTLYAGTSDGKLMSWRNNLYQVAPTTAEQWRPLGSISLGAAINNVVVGKSGIVAVECDNRVSLVYETKLGGRINDKFKVLQTSNTCLQIYYKDAMANDKIHLFDARMNVKCFDLRGSKILVWNGALCVLCDIFPDRDTEIVTQCASFDCHSKFLCFHKNGVIKIMQYMIQVVNYQGVVKQEINFSKSEGEIIGYDYGKGTLLIYTSKNFIRNISISKRELKTVGMIKNLEQFGQEGLRIKEIKVNYDGNKAAIMVNSKKKSERLFYVWNIESDVFVEHIFEENFDPLGFAWEHSDGRFLGVFGIFTKTGGLTEKKIQTYFVTKEDKIKKHDEIAATNLEGIFAVEAPNILGIIRNTTINANISYTLNNIFMPQFNGADKSDPVTLKSIMNFNYYLTDGDMDEAHKSIKHIDSADIWKNMAEMSIKNRRVDVAETCIANMKFARGSKALRELRGKDDMSKLASVAILLNMLEEAEILLKEAKRYDLLNELYQNENDWEKSVKVAEQHDRISLKMTYYKAAQNSEIHKNFQEAIKYYDMSDTGKREIPRMLADNQQFSKLEEYASTTNDKAVMSYQGQIYEECEDYETSQSYYKKAEDYGALVNLEIMNENIEEAENLCNLSNDTLACYWMGKYYETEDNNTKALEFYKKGRHYSQCIRLAKIAGEDDVIYACAIQAPKYVQCRAARYFEKKGFSEKAVILFMKGKNFKRALDLAMANNLGEYVTQITSQVDKEEADPRNLGNMAEMFEKQGDMEKAFGMYLGSGQNDKALELLQKENITLNQKAVKQLLPPKGENPEKRSSAIRILAQRLAEQSKSDIAAKLYIEIGEKILALKALINGGNTKKVINFAKTCRSPEAYILAANFLQSTDWHNQDKKHEKILEYIISFYRKAKRFDSLAKFYVSCAMLEIDEYKNYEKALKATQSAKKCAEKGHNTALIAKLDTNIINFQRFIAGRNALKAGGGESSIADLKELTSDPSAKDALRVGDVYAVLFEYYALKDMNQEAWHIAQEMKKKNYQVTRYLDLQYLEKVSQALGKSLEDNQEDRGDELSPWGGNNTNLDNEDPLPNEEIIEEFEFDD